MKIEDLRSEQKNNRAKIAATITWEDSDREVQEIYFETSEELANDLTCNPHSFLVACIMPAMRYGEKRIAIDAEICPELRDGLITAMAWMRNWYDRYDPDQKLVRIEARTQQHVSPLSKKPRAGFLFSGGIDSTATLLANRTNYPLEHPGSIKDGLIVQGLEVREPKNFEFVLSSMAALAKHAGLRVLPVYTNIRSLGPDNDLEFWESFWVDEFMGAAFAAIGHAFSKCLSVVSINGNYDIPNQKILGSHPVLDLNYSSSDLRIRHEGIVLSRYEKTKLIAEWDPALKYLRVCNKSAFYQDGRLNCGECEKCLRTMLALLAIGALKKSSAFAVNDITEELIQKAVILNRETFPLYEELMTPLSEIGRHDLVHAIQRRKALYLNEKRKMKWRKGAINSILEFDQKILKGNLKRFKKLVWT